MMKKIAFLTCTTILSFWGFEAQAREPYFATPESANLGAGMRAKVVEEKFQGNYSKDFVRESYEQYVGSKTLDPAMAANIGAKFSAKAKDVMGEETSQKMQEEERAAQALKDFIDSLARHNAAIKKVLDLFEKTKETRAAQIQKKQEQEEQEKAKEAQKSAGDASKNVPSDANADASSDSADPLKDETSSAPSANSYGFSDDLKGRFAQKAQKARQEAAKKQQEKEDEELARKLQEEENRKAQYGSAPQGTSSSKSGGGSSGSGAAAQAAKKEAERKKREQEAERLKKEADRLQKEYEEQKRQEAARQAEANRKAKEAADQAERERQAREAAENLKRQREDAQKEGENLALAERVLITNEIQTQIDNAMPGTDYEANLMIAQKRLGLANTLRTNAKDMQLYAAIINMGTPLDINNGSELLKLKASACLNKRIELLIGLEQSNVNKLQHIVNTLAAAENSSQDEITRTISGVIKSDIATRNTPSDPDHIRQAKDMIALLKELEIWFDSNPAVAGGLSADAANLFNALQNLGSPKNPFTGSDLDRKVAWVYLNNRLGYALEMEEENLKAIDGFNAVQEEAIAQAEIDTSLGAMMENIIYQRNLMKDLSVKIVEGAALVLNYQNILNMLTSGAKLSSITAHEKALAQYFANIGAKSEYWAISLKNDEVNHLKAKMRLTKRIEHILKLEEKNLQDLKDLPVDVLVSERIIRMITTRNDAQKIVLSLHDLIEYQKGRIVLAQNLGDWSNSNDSLDKFCSEHLIAGEFKRLYQDLHKITVLVSEKWMAKKISQKMVELETGILNVLEIEKAARDAGAAPHVETPEEAADRIKTQEILAETKKIEDDLIAEMENLSNVDNHTTGQIALKMNTVRDRYYLAAALQTNWRKELEAQPLNPANYGPDEISLLNSLKKKYANLGSLPFTATEKEKKDVRDRLTARITSVAEILERYFTGLTLEWERSKFTNPPRNEVRQILTDLCVEDVTNENSYEKFNQLGTAKIGRLIAKFHPHHLGGMGTDAVFREKNIKFDKFKEWKDYGLPLPCKATIMDLLRSLEITDWKDGNVPCDETNVYLLANRDTIITKIDESIARIGRTAAKRKEMQKLKTDFLRYKKLVGNNFVEV